MSLESRQLEKAIGIALDADLLPMLISRGGLQYVQDQA